MWLFYNYNKYIVVRSLLVGYFKVYNVKMILYVIDYNIYM